MGFMGGVYGGFWGLPWLRDPSGAQAAPGAPAPPAVAARTLLSSSCWPKKGWKRRNLPCRYLASRKRRREAAAARGEMDSLGGRLEAQKLLDVELSSTWKSCREREIMGVN